MRRDEHERVWPEEALCAVQQATEVVLDPPALPLRTVAVTRWVEDKTVVLAPAPELASCELHGAVDDPADRSIGQVGPRGVVACPRDCRPGAVHVRNGGAP